MCESSCGIRERFRLLPLQTCIRQILGTALAASLAGPAAAGYSQIIAFGDSLSDTGNLYALTSILPTGGIPGAPYYQGRFSNGQLAVEAMASNLGLNLTSYAYGGAQTGLGNEGSALLFGTGVAGQIMQFESKTPHVDDQALYFVWAGPNDFYAGDNMLSATTSVTASNNLLSDIHKLYDQGARDFFVPLMPDLSVTPDALRNTASYRDAAATRTTEYNQYLGKGLGQLANQLAGAHIQMFDTPSFMSKTVPALISAGINVTDPCYDAQQDTVCSFEPLYLFWDGVHPSNTGDWILGQAFAQAVLAVPEPGQAVMLLWGLLMMTYQRLRVGGSGGSLALASSRASARVTPKETNTSSAASLPASRQVLMPSRVKNMAPSTAPAIRLKAEGNCSWRR
ncbi:MAG: hypothetical protein EKK47_02570 [Burkholderiales bacterium]|nr:MAG: hypothetical protein EKK47_02570 [Burkholderiales bacterium]